MLFKNCWNIIKSEVMRVIDQFYHINQHYVIQYLNQALVVLIPKKPNAERITEFWPISLIHSFAKLLSKLMANRLALELKNLISRNKNAFTKRRCIHENFLFVQQMIKELHNKKTPTFSLNCTYLMPSTQLIGASSSKY
jgi:hypothetical protein